MPRYVILEHRPPQTGGKPLHWDLMLEDAGKLLTWELSQLPSSHRAVDAIELPRHRLAYLEYEGPISNDRGEVRRVAGGDFDWVRRTDSIEIVVRGDQYTGTLKLDRVAGAQRWIVRFGESKDAPD